MRGKNQKKKRKNPKNLKVAGNYPNIGCPTSYSCHVDSVHLYSKFESDRIGSNTEIQSSNMFGSDIPPYQEGHGVFQI